MKTRSVLTAVSIAVGSIICGTSPAFAFQIQVPEPSALSIYGVAVAGLIIAYRLRNRK
ncbi:MAG: hypothetical protein HOM58_07535 [Rhodospirillaceae bacterium]|jgi:hypothetical protein|nr:hypothetical protein [Rhodospirillaceae bacterium]